MVCLSTSSIEIYLMVVSLYLYNAQGYVWGVWEMYCLKLSCRMLVLVLVVWRHHPLRLLIVVDFVKKEIWKILMNVIACLEDLEGLSGIGRLFGFVSIP